MRLGLSSPLAHENAKDWAKRMVELGCRCVNFPIEATAPESVIADYVDAAHDNDLLIAEVGIWRNVLATDRQEREEARARAVRQLKLADEIGALCCANTSGTYGGPVWDGGYRENFSRECREEVIRYTRELLDEVNPKNTKYSIEPMPWMIPTGPDDYLKLLQEVDREGMGVHMDFINMINCPERYFFMDEFMDECFDKLGPLIDSCHLKDIKLLDDLTFQLRETFCGDGIMNMEKYVSLIDKYNPEMPLIIEHLDTDQQYLDSLAYVKNRLGIN